MSCASTSKPSWSYGATCCAKARSSKHRTNTREANHPMKQGKGSRHDLSRRKILKAGGAALLAGPVSILGTRDALAQPAGNIRVWTTQGAPLQRQAYDYMVKTFEAAHPGLKVS